jgi:NAD(P)-dependent dehydrogenase (short-subunit alcohol dehydrogenase family)
MSVIVHRKLLCRATARYASRFSRGLSSYQHENEPEVRQRIALVLGSSGCLGNAVAHHFSTSLGIKILGADVVSPSDDFRTALHSFIQLPAYDHPAAVSDVTRSLVEGLDGVLEDGEELDAIICANGGWIGDPKLPNPDDTDDNFMAGIKDYGDIINKMLEMNLFPVLAAGYAANKFMADEG